MVESEHGHSTIHLVRWASCWKSCSRLRKRMRGCLQKSIVLSPRSIASTDRQAFNWHVAKRSGWFVKHMWSHQHAAEGIYIQNARERKARFGFSMILAVWFWNDVFLCSLDCDSVRKVSSEQAREQRDRSWKLLRSPDAPNSSIESNSCSCKLSKSVLCFSFNVSWLPDNGSHALPSLWPALPTIVSGCPLRLLFCLGFVLGLPSFWLQSNDRSLEMEMCLPWSLLLFLSLSLLFPLIPFTSISFFFSLTSRDPFLDDPCSYEWTEPWKKSCIPLSASSPRGSYFSETLEIAPACKSIY